MSGKLTHFSSSVKTYLFSVGKNKLMEMERGKLRERKLKTDDLYEADEIYDDSLLTQVEDCVEKLGEPCRSLLIQYYYHKRSIDQLVSLFGYKNMETAKNQKYKCLERLRKMVKEVQLTGAR